MGIILRNQFFVFLKMIKERNIIKNQILNTKKPKLLINFDSFAH